MSDAWWVSLSVGQLLMLAVWGERGYGDGMTQQYRLASMAVWLSSTGISHPNILPHVSLVCLSAVNSSPCPGIAPQSLHSSFQLLCLLGELCPCPGYCGYSNDCLILIPFRLPQINCFTLSLKYFSSGPDNCPDMGIRFLLKFPHLPSAGPVLLTFLFSPLVPSPYRVLHSPIYSFLMVRYSCLLSTGVLQAFLCSQCIHGERCTPRPPTPPPSCSPPVILIFKNHFWDEIYSAHSRQSKRRWKLRERVGGGKVEEGRQ